MPLWGLAVFLLYAPRRVQCPDCGVKVERLPWATGKSRLTTIYMWFLANWAKRFLNVIAEKAGQAVHVLDRFHIMAQMNKAIDEVRAGEAKRLKREGRQPLLKHSRWCLLKRPENLTSKQTVRLAELLKCNLRTVRAYLLREDFQRFWDYRLPACAGRFVTEWCNRAMRSRLGPMKRVAKMLRRHHELILNWFRAKGTISSGVVEGLNYNAKLTMKKAYGYRTAVGIKIALYHRLGALPEPEFTHKFW